MNFYLIILTTLISLSAFGHLKVHTSCQKVNGSGVHQLHLTYTLKGLKLNQVRITLPPSSLGPQTKLEKTFAPPIKEFYGATFFIDDGSVTYSAILAADTDSDYVLLTTSGDVDTKTSLYRCHKTNVVLE